MKQIYNRTHSAFACNNDLFKNPMNKLVCSLVCLIMSVVFTSCGGEDEQYLTGNTYYTIDITSAGLPEDAEVSSSSISANIPAAGLSFSLQGHGEYAPYMVVAYVDLREGKNDIDIETPSTWEIEPFSNEYLSVRYEENHTIFFEIKPNDTGYVRKYRIPLGYCNAFGMCANQIFLVQSGAEAMENEDA